MTTSIADPLGEGAVPGYQILARIGGGGMGVVYKARDLGLDRIVALKFLPAQWSHDEGAKQRFVREAQAAGATNHPNICTIHDIRSTPDGQLFIVMAFYEGETLKQRLERGALPIEEALDIATQVADGLAKAHGRGVTHRDVKPGNLILTEDGVRILDFGLATFVDALQLTMAGSTLGTAAYMSPEQARGEDADARADVWSVGIVLYEMLAGHVPFRGAYAEAVAHAIRNETPAPLRDERPEVPEDVEQLVFRALHKDPTIRFASGRELARALRQVRGQSMPIDLLTQVIPPPVDAVSLRRPRRAWRAWAVAIGLVLAVAAALSTWALWPVERTKIVVAPFGNQTGDPDLEQYRLALTHTLTLALDDSRDLSVTPYGRVTEVLRRFQQAGADPSNREAIQAITANSGASLVVVPTLLRDGGAWRARVELRNAQTATNVREHETNPVTSSLSRDTAFQLAATIGADVDGLLKTRRSRVVDTVRGWMGFGGGVGRAHVRSLDAAKAFADGLAAYDDLEYAQARQAFRAATELDARNPLLLAWLSRAALVLRDENEANDAAQRAMAALANEASSVDAMFVRAVAAEANRESAAAERVYRELVAERPDDPSWTLELAGFLDRQTKTADAVAAYHDALQADSRLLRPHLELCRLYSPSRLNEPANAKTEGQASLAAYRAIGARGGEAQSLLCLADTLRVGTDAERVEARKYTEAALATFDDLRYAYNAARADYYIALLAGVAGRTSESISVGEKALAAAVQSGNTPLQPIVLNNLGVAYVGVGDYVRAAEYYQRAFKMYQSWREEARAARIQANRGVLLVEYGNPDEGVLDVRNALAVAERLGDKSFEAICLRYMATFYRNQGRHAQAISEINRGLAIARERNLTDSITALTTSLAISQFELGEYHAARQSLLQVLREGSGRRTDARIRLARTRVRIGDLANAATDLAMADGELRASPNEALRALLLLVHGELAYESGLAAGARSRFAEASALWVADRVPEAPSVEARAALGLLTANAGNVEGGRQMIRASIEAAEKLHIVGLEARCRLLLARLEVGARRFDQADAALTPIRGDDSGQTIGPERSMEMHAVRARIHVGRGDAARAAAEAAAARSLVERIRAQLPESDRALFDKRATIRAISP